MRTTFTAPPCSVRTCHLRYYLFVGGVRCARRPVSLRRPSGSESCSPSATTRPVYFCRYSYAPFRSCERGMEEIGLDQCPEEGPPLIIISRYPPWSTNVSLLNVDRKSLYVAQSSNSGADQTPFPFPPSRRCAKRRRLAVFSRSDPLACFGSKYPNGRHSPKLHECAGG